MKMIDCDRHDDGVSEALGFMLIFGLVIVGVGLVTLYGYPMLLQQQTSADEQIMEKNMIVLQNDVKGLAYKTVPYKETALKIGEGTLTVYDPDSSATLPTFRIYDENGIDYVTAYKPGDLRWVSDSAHTDISLQNGAVVMRDHVDPGSVMLAEPRWYYDAQTNTVVINMINMTSTFAISRAGIGTVQMQLIESNYTRYDIDTGTKLFVSYTPPASGEQNYETAWNNYFVNTVGMTEQPVALPERRYLSPADLNRPTVLVIKKYVIWVKSV